MTMRERLPARASDSVDLAATLDLLAQLAQYAEAGAVQPHTLAQAAQHALERHGDHIDVLVAVGKLYLSTGERAEAARVLGRAEQVAPADKRASQLLAEAGLEADTSESASPKLQSFIQTTGARSTNDAAARSGNAGSAPPSTGRPVTPHRDATKPPTRSIAATARDEARKVGDTIAPTTPRSAAAPDGPALRPTVRMARVQAPPASTTAERGRWPKPGEAREPHDSKPERDEPSSDGPKSTRGRVDPITPSPTSIRSPREGNARSARAATGHLKLLDPADARRHLDRYELIGEIASGGMASVFLARLAGVAGFQRFFAIKRLHPHLADEQEFIDMFLDEARLAAGIHHPNVVSILEVGTTHAGYYLVMDYIEGDTLSGVINRGIAAGGLPRPIALRIVLDALHGLHAAHELTDQDGNPVDLVHRDCSPQNILVGMDGSSRITDFGVARASSRLSTTRGATVKGKLAYLSPEQATGRGLDRRSDLFGMGVILWEVLACRRLFRADSDGATLSRILVEPIPSLAEFAPDLPLSVIHAVSVALARDPQDRYATAADMVDAVEQAVRDAADPRVVVASPREVASYVRELFGVDLTARRDAVRTWIQQCQEAVAQSGPRSQGFRNPGAESPPPPSSRREEAPISESEPDVGPESEPETPASEPPSSKTEPSAVHPDEPPPSRAPVIETKTAPLEEEKIEPAPAEVEVVEQAADPVNPTLPAATSPVRSARPPAAIKVAPKGPPTALIVIAALLVVLAVFAYLARSKLL